MASDWLIEWKNNIPDISNNIAYKEKIKLNINETSNQITKKLDTLNRWGAINTLTKNTIEDHIKLELDNLEENIIKTTFTDSKNST